MFPGLLLYLSISPNGDMVGAWVNVYETWLIKPKKYLITVMLVGVEIF